MPKRSIPRRHKYGVPDHAPSRKRSLAELTRLAASDPAEDCASLLLAFPARPVVVMRCPGPCARCAEHDRRVEELVQQAPPTPPPPPTPPLDSFTTTAQPTEQEYIDPWLE